MPDPAAPPVPDAPAHTTLPGTTLPGTARPGPARPGHRAQPPPARAHHA